MSKTDNSTKPGLTFDTEALVLLEKGDDRIIALLARAVEHDVPIRIPAASLARLWTLGIRPSRTATLLRSRRVTFVSLDQRAAIRTGMMCAAADCDNVIDIAALLCARDNHDVIITHSNSPVRNIDTDLAIADIGDETLEENPSE